MPSISERDLNRLRTSVQELTALNQIATAINLSMSVDNIVQVILDNSLERASASQGAVFLLENTSGDAPEFSTFIRKIAEPCDAPPLHLNYTLLGWMTKHKQILAMNSPSEDKRFKGIDFEKLGITSVLAAPLISQNGLIGALVLFNKDGSEGFTGEDKRFLGIVGSQTAKVIENARLFEKERKLQALEEEMKVAKSIQDSYLPSSSHVTKQHEILGYNSPAKDVGGDYFDWFSISEHKMVLSIGDVAGKGVPAALLASEAQAVIRSLLRHNPQTTLRELARSLNDLFVDMTRPEQYLTAFLAVYDSQTGILEYINAGHVPPTVVSSTGETQLLEGSGLIIGALPNRSYPAHSLRLNAGDTLFLCTDGVTENFGPNNEEFGLSRTRAFLSTRGTSSLGTVRDELIESLTAFRQDQPPSDDITFLILRVK
jgi:sigma-B regulation protein RsbU (phosphoserine phosphatase)